MENEYCTICQFLDVQKKTHTCRLLSVLTGRLIKLGRDKQNTRRDLRCIELTTKMICHLRGSKV